MPDIRVHDGPISVFTIRRSQCSRWADIRTFKTRVWGHNFQGKPFQSVSPGKQGPSPKTAPRATIYRYCGAERDDETGFYVMGVRYYCPWLGRWTTADPLGLQAGINLYLYCRAGPVVFSDPSGTEERGANILQTGWDTIKAPFEGGDGGKAAQRTGETEAVNLNRVLDGKTTLSEQFKNPKALESAAAGIRLGQAPSPDPNPVTIGPSHEQGLVDHLNTSEFSPQPFRAIAKFLERTGDWTQETHDVAGKPFPEGYSISTKTNAPKEAAQLGGLVLSVLPPLIAASNIGKAASAADSAAAVARAGAEGAGASFRPPVKAIDPDVEEVFGGSKSGEPTTTLHHGGVLGDEGVQPRAFSTTPDLAHAEQYAKLRGGQVYTFDVPTRTLRELEASGQVQRLQDTLMGTNTSAPEFRFKPNSATLLNQFLRR